MYQHTRFAAAALWVATALLALGTACGPAPAPSGAVARDASAPPAEPAPAATTSSATAPPAAPAAPPRLLTAEELADGWLALFDGETLFGWKANSPADWRVADGVLQVSAGEPGLLYTTAEFADYVLKFEFRCPPTTNSGVFLHTPEKPTDPATDCYELNLAGPDNPFPTGSLVQRKKAAGTFASADWQTCEATLVGGKVTVHVNGQPAVEYEDPQPLARGRIGLQFKEGPVAFRQLKLKPLGLTSLFNGRDLSGWKTYPQMASKFTVTAEGCLHVAGGRGQLETERSFGDFVLQLECCTHAPGLNSGVFFRCLPGQEMMGYESQIHNGFKNGDRAQPADCGTGGIFRRCEARCVVADDRVWFTQTLLAHGPHVAVWVDGYQVTDWTDERPPDPNPRKGRRVEPGTLMLQGHDPTTDISFRHLRAAELAPRRK